MKKSVLWTNVLVFLEVLIVFAVLCVFPFAWILRDGLGPDSVSTTGLTALSKAFMSFYIGPVIVVLVALDLAIRRFAPAEEEVTPRSKWAMWFMAVVFVIFLSFALVSLLVG